MEIRGEVGKRIGCCDRCADNDVVALKERVCFMCWEEELISGWRQRQRRAEGKFAEGAESTIVRPDKLAEAEESMEARENLGNKEEVIVGRGDRK